MALLSNLHQWIHRKDSKSKTALRSSKRRLNFEGLESRQLLSGNHFDFGAPTSPVAPGYVGVPVVAYDAARGYGWTNTANIKAVDRGVPDSLVRDFHAGNDGTFLVDLPNGVYQVTAQLGDARYVRDDIDMYLNGAQVASNIYTPAGQYTKLTYGATVTNGQLSLQLVDKGGQTASWTLNSLDIDPDAGPSVVAGPSLYASEGVVVNFNGTATGIGPLTYTWQFGDGTSSTGSLTPQHIYYNSGKYTATLLVTDAYGATAQDTDPVSIADLPPRPNALGPYSGAAGAPVHFVGIARDPSPLDTAAGFTYAWKFGDGSSAAGPAPDHTYAAPGTYTVTFTATDQDGYGKSITTTATIGPAGSISATSTEYQILSNNLQANVEYSKLTWTDMASSGAWGVNAQWENGTSSKWYIEQQRYGEGLIIQGLLHNDTNSLNAGFKAFDWGFAHQAADGSFSGTQDPFHSTSMFVEAVAHASLLISQSPYAAQYQAKVSSYAAKLYKAANWMASPTVWNNGLLNDAPYTHRRYVVADALALTGKLVGGDSRLMSLAQSEINDGLSLQWANGVNPELGGYDSSYQTFGLALAERWATYFPSDSHTPKVNAMIEKGLAWEATMILPTGEISMAGNSRSGTEIGPSGTVKTVDWKSAMDAFAYWFQVTGNSSWQNDARDIAEFYYKLY
jgi:PKD repeat protein